MVAFLLAKESVRVRFPPSAPYPLSLMEKHSPDLRETGFQLPQWIPYERQGYVEVGQALPRASEGLLTQPEFFLHEAEILPFVSAGF